MKICVVSDVHFKYSQKTAEDRENAAVFLDFLSGCVGQYDVMVLNGDIFDLWNDWQQLIIRQYFPVLHRLARISEEGCRIVYISGNHDFWFNGFLEQDLGFELYYDQFFLAADGKKMLFSHGDLHTTNDLRYQLFRRFIRMPLIRRFFNFLHPWLALRLGQQMSRSSRLKKLSSFMQMKRGKGLKSWAEQNIKKGKADIVVLGHSHHPQIQKLGAGIYANAGDWLFSHSYLEIMDSEVSLKYYKNKEKAK